MEVDLKSSRHSPRIPVALMMKNADLRRHLLDIRACSNQETIVTVMQRRDAVCCLRTRLESTGCSSGSFVPSVRATSTSGCARLVSKNTMTTSACLADVWVGAPVIVAREHSKRSASSGVVLADTAALFWGAGHRPELCLRHHHPRSVFCVGVGFVRRPHLLFGGVHSVDTNPRGK